MNNPYFVSVTEILGSNLLLMSQEVAHLSSITSSLCKPREVNLWPGLIVQFVHISFLGAPTTGLQPFNRISVNFLEIDTL